MDDVVLCPWVAGMSEACRYIQDDSSCHSLELVWSGDSSVSEEMQGGSWITFTERRSLKKSQRMDNFIKGRCERTVWRPGTLPSPGYVSGRYRIYIRRQGIVGRV